MASVSFRQRIESLYTTRLTGMRARLLRLRKRLPVGLMGFSVLAALFLRDFVFQAALAVIFVASMLWLLWDVLPFSAWWTTARRLFVAVPIGVVAVGLICVAIKAATWEPSPPVVTPATPAITADMHSARTPVGTSETQDSIF